MNNLLTIYQIIHYETDMNFEFIIIVQKAT